MKENFTEVHCFYTKMAICLGVKTAIVHHTMLNWMERNNKSKYDYIKHENGKNYAYTDIFVFALKRQLPYLKRKEISESIEILIDGGFIFRNKALPDSYTDGEEIDISSFEHLTF